MTFEDITKWQPAGQAVTPAVDWLGELRVAQAAAGQANGFSACQPETPQPDNARALASTNQGQQILHRVFEIANEMPSNATLQVRPPSTSAADSPDFIRVFGRDGAQHMAHFGITRIERQGNKISVDMQNEIQDGDWTGRVTIHPHVEFAVDRSGPVTVVSHMRGVEAGALFINKDVGGFTLVPLNNGYLGAQMDVQGDRHDLCISPRGDVYQP